MSLVKFQKKCRNCQSKKIEKIINLKSVPINELYEKTKKKSLKHKKFNQTIIRCKECTHVQLMENIDPAYMWQRYTYLTSQNKEVVSHFKKISMKLLSSYKLKNKLIVDIGSNDGTLLNNFKKISRTIGIEPSVNVSKIAKENGISTYNEYFNKKTVKKIISKHGKAKIVFAFNVFAHTQNVSEFTKNVKDLIEDEGLFVFEAQYLGSIYKKFILGTFFHEHMSHHSFFSLNQMFRKNGLEFVDVIKSINQLGSFIGFIKKIKKTNKISKNIKIFQKYEKLNQINTKKKLLDFGGKIKRHQQICKKIISKYKDYSGYGAARSGPIYCENFEIDFPKIVFDENKKKIGKFFPNYGSKILSTKIIEKYSNNLFVILAYIYSKKIIRKNLKNIKNKNFKFLIFHPIPKIISKENVISYLNEEN